MIRAADFPDSEIEIVVEFLILIVDNINLQISAFKEFSLKSPLLCVTLYNKRINLFYFIS